MPIDYTRPPSERPVSQLRLNLDHPRRTRQTVRPAHDTTIRLLAGQSITI